MLCLRPDKPTTAFFIYLGIISILGGAIVYLATSRLGPGVSTDSAVILSTAENLAKGRGLLNYWGVQLTQFPPLYSIILALGSLLFGKDVFIIGWALNVVVFPALIWFSGLYFFFAFREEPLLAWLGSFVVFTSASLIQISANIASDPLFMLMVVFFLMAATLYLKTGRLRYLVPAAVLTILACFQRYAGLSLVIAGGLIVACNYRNSIRGALLGASLYAILTAIPIFLWGYLHNAPVNGTVFGGRLPAVPLLNFVAGAEKLLYWFIPLQIISLVSPLVLLAAILALIIVLIFKIDPAGFLKRLGSPFGIPSVAFLLVYAAVLVFDISYYELKGVDTDRVHIVALPSLLIILLSVGDLLVKASKRRFGNLPVYFSAVLLFAVWSVYPIGKVSQYVSSSMKDGDVSAYNSINKPGLRNSMFSAYLAKLDIHNSKVYSNGDDSAWFILRAQVYSLPGVPSDEKHRIVYVQGHYAGWPGPGNGGYIVWFNSEAYKGSSATPHELTSVADINQVYGDEYGSVYYVNSP